jgi:hypothetical protein
MVREVERTEIVPVDDDRPDFLNRFGIATGVIQ